MTIEFDGHVFAMSTQSTGNVGDISIELRVEGMRSLENIKINASAAEAHHYKPGIPVKVQIRPHVTPSSGSAPCYEHNVVGCAICLQSDRGREHG